jgi:hypothetical protein
MPIRSHKSASSFTRAMFTERKMFSSSFVISATRGLETMVTCGASGRSTAAASSAQSGVTPPTTFGVFCTVCSAAPGSMRSGLKARKKSRPARRPPRSSRGRMASSVVPG